MTVRQLIEDLKELPPDAKVVAPMSCTYSDIEEIQEAFLLTKPDSDRVGPQYVGCVLLN